MARRTLTVLALLGLTWFPIRVSSVGAQSNRQPGAAGAHLSMHRLWRQHISPNADSAPAYLSHVAARKINPVLYVLAANNNSNCNPGDPVRKAALYALNATDGSVRWVHSTSGPSRCSTAGPAVDPSGRWVYAPGLDGKVHRYASLSGKETIGGHWPVTITLMPDVEKISAPLTVAGHYLYVTTSGFIGDAGHYGGHLVTIDLASGRSRVFNSLCSNVHALLGSDSGKSNYCRAERSGLFGRGQGVVDPVTRAVYIVSGNGAWNGKTNWGDSILKLNASGNKLLDSYTPTNQAALDAGDLDLGSTGPGLLAPIRSGGHSYHLLTQGGKGPACDSCGGAAIRLLNRDNLSGRGGPGHLGGDLSDAQAPGGCEVLTAPAVWKAPSGTPWVVYANSCGVAGYRVIGRPGHFQLDRVWSSSSGGTTPVVSGGVVYLASAGRVTALNPSTGKQVGRISDLGDIHWEYPRLAGHRLFISDQSGNVSAYALSG